MPFSLHDASVPLFVNALTTMRAWLDKAADREGELIGARLIEDMRPLSSQYQIASDTAKAAVARLIGETAPAMADTESSFAELKERCTRTIDYIAGVDPARFDGAAERPVELKFPNGMGYAFSGASFLTGFALPNFFFHVTTAYAILRKEGVPLGKPDFLQHLGAPNLPPGA